MTDKRDSDDEGKITERKLSILNTSSISNSQLVSHDSRQRQKPLHSLALPIAPTTIMEHHDVVSQHTQTLQQSFETKYLCSALANLHVTM